LQIGRHVTDRWVQGSEMLIEASELFRLSPERIFHVRYKDMVVDPIGIVSALYRHFGRTLGARAEAALKRALVQRPNGGYGQNHYSFEDYGIDPAADGRRFSTYVAYFRIEPERVAEGMRSQSDSRLAV